MDTANFIGKMVKYSKVNMTLTKRTVKEFLFLAMDLSFKEHGKMVRFMEKVKLQRKMDKLK